MSDQPVLTVFPGAPPVYRERRWRDRATRRLRLSRRGYPMLLRLSRRRAVNAVSRRTDLLIDGFPRSANTFVVAHVAGLNPGLSIAHHAHAVSQFVVAQRRGVPSILLVRRPVDAVASVRAGWAHWSAGVDADADLRYWIEFHERIRRWAPDVRVVAFERLEHDLERINEEWSDVGIRTASPDGLDAEEIAAVVEQIAEYQRGTLSSDSRSSSPRTREAGRTGAAEHLRPFVDPGLVDRADRLYAELVGPS